MKLERIKRIKIFIVLIAVLFVLITLMINSKDGAGVVVHAQNGAQLYATHCVRCHGGDGRGQTPKGKQTGAKDFTNPKWQAIEARGIRAITSGKGNMPAFKNTLNQEQIRAVWEHVRGFKR